MGVSVSRYSELSENSLIERFASADAISPNDPFWNQFLSFNITPPSSIEEQLLFDSSVEHHLQRFLAHNPRTGHLDALVRAFIARATELLASPSADSAMLAWQTYNALFVIRACVRYLMDVVPVTLLAPHWDAPAPPARMDSGAMDDDEATDHKEREARPAAGESRLEMLIDALVGLICDVPVTDNTYYLHLECINTILDLMSVYIYSVKNGQEKLVESSLIYRTLFGGRYAMHGPLLVRTLCGGLCALRPAPAHRFGLAARGGSVVIDLAFGLWNILTLTSPPKAGGSILSHPPVDKAELEERLAREHPVANQSCLLLLALTNHCFDEDNVYRKALFSCLDSKDTNAVTPSKDDSGASTSAVSPLRIDMAALHNALCATAPCDHYTLLLYLMLHKCPAYRRYVHTQADLETLILPIIQSLYHTPDAAGRRGGGGGGGGGKSPHIFMSLIVLLILTEDDALIKNVHQIIIKNPTWYVERSLAEISLGGLMVLVIARTAQYNMSRLKDSYLHNNCLAALANMSSELRNLHPYVCQRLISLYEMLVKRKAKLQKDLGEEYNNSEERTIEPVEGADENWDQIFILNEVMNTLLEILNACLSNQLPNNLNLVYALLLKKDLFKHSKDSSPIMSNIEMVIGYFSSRLQRAQGDAALGVSKVMEVIRRGAEQWSNDRLQKFPALKFRYVEEDDKPQEFFTPYVWDLICSSGAVSLQAAAYADSSPARVDSSTEC